MRYFIAVLKNKKKTEYLGIISGSKHYFKICITSSKENAWIFTSEEEAREAIKSSCASAYSKHSYEDFEVVPLQIHIPEQDDAL